MTAPRTAAERKEWLIVSFGGEGGWTYGARGKRKPVPSGPVATIGIPITDEIRSQLIAYGWQEPQPQVSEKDALACIVDAAHREYQDGLTRAAPASRDAWTLSELQRLGEPLQATPAEHGDHPRDSYRYDGCPACTAQPQPSGALVEEG